MVRNSKSDIMSWIVIISQQLARREGGVESQREGRYVEPTERKFE